MKEGCPSQASLETFVESGQPDGDVRRHCAHCAACRARVAELHADAEFLREVRAAGVVTAPSPVLSPADAPGRPPASPEPDAGPRPHPDLLEGYRILDEIHRGGQGVVYRAVQIATQRTVALKMLLAGRSATDREKQRFEREARIAAGLRHPNIVTVYDGGFMADGRYAFAMEHIEGQPLDRWSAGLTRAGDNRGHALRERLRVMAKVCDAVLCAHQHAIVHRDLKPANILVDGAGEPHVLDFGIARDLGPEERTRLTQAGGFAGTLAYASPEQVSGDPSRVDTRTDIYSLGVIMYEMMSGRMPYAVEGSMASAIRNIEQAEPEPLSRRTRDGRGPFVDGEVSTIILKAMAKDPARRYQTVAGLGNDIKRYLAGEAIEARRDSTWYVLRKTAAKHRLALSGAVLVFVLLAAFGATMAWQRKKLAVALSDSTIERGRARVQLGNIPEAASLLWAELLDAPAGVERWNPDDDRLPLSRAWWALWELYAAHPCAATIRTSGPIGPADVNVLLPVPGQDDLVLIGDGAGSLGLWTLPDLRLRTKATTPADPGPGGRPPVVLQAAFTPGDEIVTVAADNKVRRWDANTLERRGPPVELPPTIPGWYPSVSLSANGTRLAVRAASEIRVMDLGSGTLLETIPYTPHAKSRSLILSPDGEWLAYAESDGLTVRRLREPDSAIHSRLEEQSASITGMGFAAGEGAPRLFFAAGGTIFVLGLQDWSQVRPFAVVERVAFVSPSVLSDDGQWLAIAGEDRRLSIWDARGAPGAPARRYMAAHDARVTALTFISGESELLSGHEDGIVQRWDLSDLPISQRRGAFTPLNGHTQSVFALAIGEVGGGLRGHSGAEDSTVRGWDLRSGRETASSGPLGGSVESIALSGDAKTVAAAIDMGDDADVILLDAVTLREQARIEKAHVTRCADLAFSPDGATLATVGDDGFVRLWDITTRELKANLEVPNPRGDKPRFAATRTVRFSPEGNTLGWGGVFGVANLADAALIDPPRTLSGNRQAVRCLRFSPDGRRVAAAGNDSTIWIWDTATGRAIHEMKGHIGHTYAVAFSPDGRLLASGGGDGTVRLWDASTGDNLAILRDSPVEHTYDLTIFAVQFTPDGDHLFVSGNYGYLGVWDLRHYDRHIAGNLEYQLDGLDDGGRAGSVAGAARRWVERHKRAGEHDQP